MHIVLIDDHQLIIETIKNMLMTQPGVSKVTCITNVADFMESTPLNIDMIICDLMMPGTNGLKLIEYCREKLDPGIKIIVLSSLVDPQTIKQAIRLGTNGYLPKNISINELLEAIRTVNAGQQYIARDLTQTLINNIFVEEQVVHYLSPREREVLQEICNGLSVKEIAYKLGLSAHTVHAYHRSTMKKLKVTKTTDLIVYAMQNGLYIPPVKR